jgi:hypothetical protein
MGDICKQRQRLKDRSKACWIVTRDRDARYLVSTVIVVHFPSSAAENQHRFLLERGRGLAHVPTDGDIRRVAPVGMREWDARYTLPPAVSHRLATVLTIPARMSVKYWA